MDSRRNTCFLNTPSFDKFLQMAMNHDIPDIKMDRELLYGYWCVFQNVGIYFLKSIYLHICKLQYIVHCILCTMYFFANDFYGFLKINKCSCIIRRKLYFCELVFQYPVALQLCCTFTISSLRAKPTLRNRSITLNAIG